MSTVSTTIATKAERLSESGSVRRIKGHTYEVTGDHDSYSVVVGYAVEASGRCSCPARGTCSHLIAAAAFEIANPVEESASDVDPFRGIL